MNKIRKTLLAGALTLPFLMAAANYPWLTFQMSDGTELSVAAEGLTINYSDGVLSLKSSTVNQSLSTDHVKTMRFTGASSGTSEINPTLTSEAEYFDLSGKRIGMFMSAEDAKATLPSGIYIIKSKDKTTKVIF